MYVPSPPGGVGDSDVTNVSHHQLRGEGMFRDEEDGPVQVHIQTDPRLTVGTQIYLHTESILELVN